MNLAKRVLIFLGSAVLVAAMLSVLAPKATHALVATLVQVANTPANPVPTLEQEAHSAFAVQFNCSNVDNACGSYSDDIYDVPVGQTAVFESIAVACSTQSTQALAGNLSYTAPGGTNAVFALAPGTVIPYFGSNYQAAAQNLKFYAAGGTSVSFYESYTGTTADYSSGCSVTLAGHLVPAS